MLIFFGSLSVLFGSFFWWRYSWYVTVGGFFLLSFASLFYLRLFGWWESDFFFSYDLMSVCLVGLSFWLGGLMLLANWGVHVEKNFASGFVKVVVVLVVVLVVAFLVSGFFQFYIFFELSLIPTFFLILGWGYQPERLNASMYMILYTVGASLPLLSCLIYFFVGEGHLSFHLSFGLTMVGVYGKVFFFFLVLAFLVKVPVFFVHLWLPKAHVEAPVAGSMILAGVLLKLGGYGLLRMVFSLGSFVESNAVFYMSVVLWGGVVTSVICLRQVDLKALIAYSSVGHMGFFVGGVMSNNVWGWQGGLLMLLGHGLCSSAMFALANISYESVGSRSMLLTKGFLSYFPFLTFLWFLVCSSNMAAPPSLNLSSEIMLFVGVLGSSGVWLFFIGLVSFFSGAYSLYLYVSGQHGAGSVFYHSFLPMKVRGFFMVLLHWVPLNMIFLSLESISGWVV
uniref:NADH-ubiquinone oxidoreductase chain 4 n=1 Tax=Yininemertes pratensis TaxID=2057967 RepID=A0A7U3VK03_9BILA|nr:NADH dehydrogenase subunit 4 [Yininemertes pratensis]QQP01064.1 NADH dehydrogenase subunit 4 [Yininemertes pratensis]